MAALEVAVAGTRGVVVAGMAEMAVGMVGKGATGAEVAMEARGPRCSP